jgi:non-specific serine/threonine protein kinase
MQAEDPDTRSVDAVWFVPLVDLADPGRLLEALRDALELPRAPGQEPLEQVMAALSAGRTLLLLDNFEHLVEDGAPLVGALLAGAPALTCLVTSRRRLNLASEREIPVPPLPAPSLTSPLCPLLDYPSVQLFVDRARAVRAGFTVTPENAGAVAALCARLEGIPLAIELAAVRAQVLTPEQMLAHLEDRFRFLVSRQRDGEPRHQTLWAALEWSYRLLVPEVQRFFARLSVFRGGWTVAAARAIVEEDTGGSAPSRALDFLEELRECSLVEVEERAGEIRFRMLETLREFAWEQLAPAEREALERRHAEYYVALAEEIEPALFGSQQAMAFKQLEAEYDNLHAALAWSETAPEGLESGLRLSAALWWFWFIRAYLAEGWRWIDRALARAAEIGDTPPRAKALYGAGGIAWFRGDHATARRLMESSVAMWRRLEQPRGLAFALRAFGWVALDQGDLTVARAAVEESLGLFRELEDRVGIARSLHFLGRAAYLAGEHEAGRTLLHQGVALCRELDDDLILAWGLEALGKVALDDGNLVAVRAFYSEAMRVSERLGATRGIACALEGLAAGAALGGENGRAARLFGAAEAYRETQGMAILPFLDWRTDYDRQVAVVREALGEAAFSQAWAEGRSWTWEKVFAEANAPHSLPSSAGERSEASLPQVERGTVAVESGAGAGLTDAEWERLRPLLGIRSKRGRPRADDRRTLEGILYVLRTGCRWQDLPARYGSPTTCWRRLAQWQADSTWERLWTAFLETLEAQERRAWAGADEELRPQADTAILNRMPSPDY